MSGRGFKPGTDVELWLYSTPVWLKTVVASGSGTFSTAVTIPVGAPAGAHSIVAIGSGVAGAALRLSAPINVSSPTMPPTATIPTHPSPDTPMLPFVLGLLLAVAGATALSLRIERRRTR